MKGKQLRPGERVPDSGQYRLRGPRGGDQDREATLVHGKRAPATPRPGMTWALVDKTKHKTR